MRRPFRISGAGAYLPGNRISSAAMEEQLSLPPGWIEKYSGVLSRPIARHETNRFMAARAIEQALQQAELSQSDIGGLISASATYDSPLPNSAQ